MAHHAYTFSECRDATGGFAGDAELGAGSYGVVYRGILRGTPVAIKRLRGGRPDDLLTAVVRADGTP